MKVMKKEKLLKVLLAPHFSEKAAGQYIFKVAKTANKHSVKEAVEQLFQVSVKAINILNVKGAVATKFGRNLGRYASWKKAYVMLQAGQEINLA